MITLFIFKASQILYEMPQACAPIGNFGNYKFVVIQFYFGR